MTQEWALCLSVTTGKQLGRQRMEMLNTFYVGDAKPPLMELDKQACIGLARGEQVCRSSHIGGLPVRDIMANWKAKKFDTIRR
ncbi:MAG: hypothetical protein AAGI12_06485 [Pseudomonadota bacterium]